MKKIIISLAVILPVLLFVSGESFVKTTKAATDVTTTVENSYALCHDGSDNDSNGVSDMADPSCAAFAVDPSTIVHENSYALCHDGSDNDSNGVSDMADPSCADFATDPNAATTTPPTAPVTPPVTYGGGGGGGGGYLPGFNAGLVLGTSTGSVLGASTDDATTSTSTCELFKTFMRKGNKNNSKYEVIKLQKFLNSELGLKMPATGFFGSVTEQAVKKFQSKYSDAILTPWVKAGRMVKADPTGFFFKTTQHEANKLICPGTVVDAPVLK